MLLIRRFARLLPALLPAVVIPASGACSKGPAWGSENAIIAAVDPALRETLEPILREAFEREVFTTRMEPVFEVTFAPADSLGDFRRWRRIVVIQPASEGGLAADLLGGAELDAARAEGAVAEVRDRWALRQRIWVVAGPDAESTVALLRAAADSLYQVLYEDYVAREIDQMWVSEADSALYHEMLDELGFAIVLPRVYRPAAMSAPPDTRTWYNDNPRRVISVHWTRRPLAFVPDTVLAIRRAWGAALFPGDTVPASVAPVAAAGEGGPAGPDSATAALPQPAPVQVGQTTIGGQSAIRLQGVWENPTDRTTGLFVTFAVPCGERLVILDGNLYAPERTKIPYVFQFDQIFSTFRCGGEG
jgi:hypothetical protein